MQRSLAILSLSALTIGCAAATYCPAGNTASGCPRVDTGATESSLLQADRDFAVATHARGIEGWMSFYADDAIRIRYLGNMVKGYEAVRTFDTPNISDTTTILNWEPTDSHVFRGGELASTTGTYSVVSRRTADAGKELGRGRYVTMWRRENGRWLVIMDTGYPQPPAPTR
jgi:ketosteroid isomerase-like protein